MGITSFIEPLPVDVDQLIENCVEATPLTGVDMIEVRSVLLTILGYLNVLAVAPDYYFFVSNVA